MDGRAMARFTGLASRGPAAGITVVFPDGWKGGWHPARPPSALPGLDDARFLAELSGHLEGAGAARSWPVFLAGVSQGARYAEHVARHGLLPVTGLFLVAGTGLAASRRQVPVPQLRASVVLVVGNGDPTFPYQGGRLTRSGLFGLIMKRRAVRHGELPGEDVVTGAEELVGDWAMGNGIMTSGDHRHRQLRPARDRAAADGARRPAGDQDRLDEARLPSGHAVPDRRRRARLARRPAVPAEPGDRADRQAPGRDRAAARHGRQGDGGRLGQAAGLERWEIA